MADHQFDCPLCGQTLEAPDELSGSVLPCPACNHEITVPDRSLGTIGAESRSSKPVPTGKSETNSCPECGTALPQGNILCIECGYNVKTGRKIQAGRGHAATPPVAYPDPPRDRSISRALGGGAKLALVLLAFAALLWVNAWYRDTSAMRRASRVLTAVQVASMDREWALDNLPIVVRAANGLTDTAGNTESDNADRNLARLIQAWPEDRDIYPLFELAPQMDRAYSTAVQLAASRLTEKALAEMVADAADRPSQMAFKALQLRTPFHLVGDTMLKPLTAVSRAERPGRWQELLRQAQKDYFTRVGATHELYLRAVWRTTSEKDFLLADGADSAARVALDFDGTVWALACQGNEWKGQLNDLPEAAVSVPLSQLVPRASTLVAGESSSGQAHVVIGLAPDGIQIHQETVPAFQPARYSETTEYYTRASQFNPNGTKIPAQNIENARWKHGEDWQKAAGVGSVKHIRTLQQPAVAGFSQFEIRCTPFTGEE